MATRDFLLEIGSEELPSRPLDRARELLGGLLAERLDEAGLAHGPIEVISSPRRLAALAHGVAEATEATRETFRGPKAAIAFDASGAPTKAAQGFARSKGVDVADLVVREDAGGTDYVFCEVSEPSRPALELLGPIAEAVIAAIPWPRSQRWGDERVRYCRPVRWIVSLFGADLVDVTYGDVRSGRMTWGHRVLSPGPHEVLSPEAYREVLRAAHVLGHDERAAAIRTQVAALEESAGIAVEMPEGVFAEVVNLCEWPTVLAGSFEARFLDVPQEIICESMLTHQRCFPTRDAEGALTQTFVVVGNGDPACSEAIVEGNERVVRARLDDASFFYEEDRRRTLDYYLERLGDVTFQESLGTLRQKAERLSALAAQVAEAMGLDAADVGLARRAGELAKADLTSHAVVEFTDQQGVMGAYYAAEMGEPKEVAAAIRDHYRPRFAKDDLPEGAVSRAVAIADKLDTICGLFAVGQPPTGSSDPFALRRGAIGVIRMLQADGGPALRPLIARSLALLASQGIDFDGDAVAAQVARFFADRLAVMARDGGVAPDVIAAIRATGVIDPAAFLSRCHALEAFRADEAELMADLAQAHARATHLADAALGTEVDESLIEGDERRLLEAVVRAEDGVGGALERGDFASALAALAGLRAPVDRFFDAVLVMDEDEALRANRLRLLNRFAKVFAPVADVGALSGADEGAHRSSIGKVARRVP